MPRIAVLIVAAAMLVSGAVLARQNMKSGESRDPEAAATLPTERLRTIYEERDRVMPPP